MPAHRDIFVGPAGWSYADWRGRVYPEGDGTKFDTLALVAKYFNTATDHPTPAHPRESGDPGFFCYALAPPTAQAVNNKNAWIPAFAGTSGE